MTKILRVSLTILFMWCFSAFGQVIADFEEGTNGFSFGWGGALVSVSQAADTTANNGSSTGVLKLEYDFDIAASGAVNKSAVDVMGGEVLSYYVYLPADMPDSIMIKVWAQDDSWSWQDMKYYAMDIPKEKWILLDFNMESTRINSGGDFDHLSAPLQKTGLEIGAWSETDADTAWSGVVYVDNVSSIGAEPVVLASFDTGTDGFTFGWGDALTAVNHNVDSLALDLVYDFSLAASGAMNKAAVDASMGLIIAYDIYLPADFPDSIMIKVWAQDDSWSWQDVKVNGMDLPKTTWIPIYFNMEKARHASGFDFDHTTANLQKIGLEIGAWNETDTDATWAGTVMVDNVRILGTETGMKWVMADFESEIGGTQGFNKNGWGSAMTRIEWKADPTSTSDGVLNTAWAFTAGMDGPKESFSKGSIPFEQENTETMETDTLQMISFDVWIPIAIADSTLQVSMWASPAESGWSEEKTILPNEEFPAGEWATFTYDVISRVRSGEHVLGQSFSVGAQVFDLTGALDFTGEIYFDNFTLHGILEPAGELVSPSVIASVDTTGEFITYYQTNIEWEDISLGTETYNVYMSESVITNLNADGVIRIGDQVPHGIGFWNHRPFTMEPEMKTFYYVVTAVGGDGTETGITGINHVGPITLMSSPTGKAVYDADFSSKFVLDGLDTEFEEYKSYALIPETAGGDSSAGWTPESEDMTFHAVFVADDNYLYLSAAVTDDDLNADGGAAIVGGEAWMGDALEFYLGVYDASLLNTWHSYLDVGAVGTGDYRMGFTAWGTVQANGTTEYDFPGVENTVFEKFTGDGYIIEARIALDSLAMGGDFVVEHGAIIPLRIDGNDLDPNPPNNDEGRTLIAQWGSVGNHEDWKRPSSWAFLQIYDPSMVGIADNENEILPRSYKLYDNYPNPFNPTTTVKFELPKLSDVVVQIYNVVGQKVRMLLNETRTAGTHEILWDGKNDSGVGLSSGTYFLRLTAGNYTKVQKMMLLK